MVYQYYHKYTHTIIYAWKSLLYKIIILQQKLLFSTEKKAKIFATHIQNGK